MVKQRAEALRSAEFEVVRRERPEKSLRDPLGDALHAAAQNDTTARKAKAQKSYHSKCQRRAHRIAQSVDSSLFRPHGSSQGSPRVTGTELLAAEFASITALKLEFQRLLSPVLPHRWPSALEQWLASAPPANKDGNTSRFSLSFLLPLGPQNRAELATLLERDWGVEGAHAQEAASSLVAIAQRLHDERIATLQHPGADAHVAIKSSVPGGKLGSTKTVLKCGTGRSAAIVKVKSAYYQKLKGMHSLANSGRRLKYLKEDAFATIAHQLSSGGGEGRSAGGCNAAVPPEVLDALCDHFSPAHVTEAFASPLNAYLPRFCSRFVAIDSPFGSLGSFFDAPLKKIAPEDGAAIMCNPPFVEQIVQTCVDRIDHLLNQAGSERALSLILIVPNRSQKSSGVERALENRFVRNELRLQAKEHVFQEGEH